MVKVRPARPDDAPDWARMRELLWPSAGDEHAREMKAYFAGYRHDPAEVLLACDDEGRPIGFAELSLRSHAEGCVSTPVAYLEGWFVDAAHRRQGVGRALMAAVEDWARSQGCTEVASDTELDNLLSATAHQALGFATVTRIVCFRKPV